MRAVHLAGTGVAAILSRTFLPPRSLLSLPHPVLPSRFLIYLVDNDVLGYGSTCLRLRIHSSSPKILETRVMQNGATQKRLMRVLFAK